MWLASLAGLETLLLDILYTFLCFPLLSLAALPSAFLACLIMHFYLMSRERKAILLEPILALAQAAATHTAYE